MTTEIPAKITWWGRKAGGGFGMASKSDKDPSLFVRIKRGSRAAGSENNRPMGRNKTRFYWPLSKNRIKKKGKR